MKIKKGLSVLLSLALLGTAVPMLPHEAEAATVASIDDIEPGDSKAFIQFSGAKATDTFTIKITNGGTVVYNYTDTFKDVTMSADGHGTLELAMGNNNRVAQEGDIVEVSMTDNGVEKTTTKTVGEAKTPHAPTSYKVTSGNITAGANASVTFEFDAAYVPHEKDQLLVRRFDASNAELGSAYYVDLPNSNNGPVSIKLSDSVGTSYYTFQFVPGDGTSTTLGTLTVNVVTGSDTPSKGDGGLTPEQEEQINNATKLVFSYTSDKVSLGESVTPSIQLTDKSGNNKDYTGPVTFSYSGDAIVAGSFDENGRFTVGSSQDYIGTKIQVTAMVGSFSTTVELTVQASDKSLLITPPTAGKGKSRSVNFQLADGTGNRLRLLWQPTVAQVVMKGADGAAKFAGTVTDLSAITKNGSGKLLISSDIATDATVTIIFRDSEGHFYETAPSTFTFTEEEEESIKVVLNIDSYNYSVNGVDKTNDTKPVISDSRTFIPFRLMAEVLGGDVKYNNDEQSITTVYNGTTIVMKVGSKNYTINGVNYTMDVAPYINSDNRTMVPLRVLAESFGCTVTPQYSSAGTTTSVVFEK